MLIAAVVQVLAFASTSPTLPAPSLAVEQERAQAAAAVVREGAATHLGVEIAEVTTTEATTRIVLDGRFSPFDADAEDHLIEAFAGAHLAMNLVRPLDIVVRQGATLRPLGGLPKVVHDRTHASAPKRPTPFRAGAAKDRATERLPFGSALLGYRIAISAGHGWLPDGNGWRTQRDRWIGCTGCRGIVEDFFTQELVTRQVLPLLQQMGAEIVLMRDPNLRADVARQIVDDQDSGYDEQGAWSAGTAAGGWNESYRTNADTDLGAAGFSLPMTSEKPVRVSLRYLEGANRTSAAIVSVNHAAGTRTFNIDQTKMGQHWLDLGAYVMGANGSVDVAHGPSAGFLVTDAVKAGGGVWPGSDKPAWEMSAQEFIRWSGAPASVTSRSDVTIRPAFAETANPDIYLSIHANAAGVAGGSSANGISTYRYSCSTYPNFTRSDSATACDDPAGSTVLIDTVHAALVDSLHGEWDANFGDRGKLVANFGEVRELDDTPGILIETAFFDNDVDPAGSPPPSVNDNTALHNPGWREAFARGLAEGVAQYFTGGHAPPARPVSVAARNQSDGSVEVSWGAVAGALGYKVYVAREGRAYDEGTVVEGVTRLNFADFSPRDVVVFKVAALDANGEGYASAAVGARVRGAQLTGGTRPATALLVTAYDRWDARVQDEDNDLQYAVELAHAFGSTDKDVFFDGALDETVDAATLAPYDIVLWNCGKDSTFHKPFSAAARDAITALHARGGAVFASGEEIGWAMVQTSTDPADETFLTNVFGASFVADDAAAYSATGVAGLSAAGTIAFDEGTGGVYEVKFPDVFAPLGNATVGMTYPDATAAAVVTSQSVVLGFPLETVVPKSARDQLARAIVDVLAPNAARDDLDGDGATDACESDNGFDFRDDSDGAQARATCGDVNDGGPSPEPEPTPEPTPEPEPGVATDGGTPSPEPAPSVEPGAEPAPTPAPSTTPEAAPGEPDVVPFRIAPESNCACATPGSEPAPMGFALVLLALFGVVRRRHREGVARE